MPQTNQSHVVVHSNVPDPDYPNAPLGWHPTDAIVEASKDRLPLDEDHWETIRIIQEFAAGKDTVNTAELQETLEARFDAHGGMRYLYALFPKGPVAQGCRLAGLSSSDPTRGKLQ